MKRLILCIVIILSLCSCNTFRGESDESTNNIESTEPIRREETTMPVTSSVTNEPSAVQSDVLPMKFIFSSGAGAWGTVINLNADGSFTGTYHDSDMGISSDEYPYGTEHISIFEGKFENIVREDEYTYTMTLTEVKTETPAGEEWVEDGRKYIASEPYGLVDGNEFKLYLPETPLSEVPEEFLSWWPNRWNQNEETLDTWDATEF